MTDVLARAAELVAAINATGIKATSDPAAVNALMRPTEAAGAGCVLVVPLPLFVNPALCGDWQTTWQIVAMAPRGAKGQIPAERLIAMVELVVDALPITEARPSTYALEQGQPGYPAYTMTLED